MEEIAILRQPCFLFFCVLPVLVIVPLTFDGSLFFYKQLEREVQVSSVWCTDGFNRQKTCRFQNICYSPHFKAFLFYLSSDSIIKGLKHYSELQNIQLSTVNNHNQFFANISMIKDEYFINSRNENFVHAGILFSRFKPDNVMHSIHDDLLPLFFTLEELCMGIKEECFNKYKLIFHDRHPKGPYFDLYELFSVYKPIFLKEQTNDICFDELVMGLNQESIFYQYGFSQPHGPVSNIGITQLDIDRFTNFMKSKLNIKEINHSKKTNIVLVSRKQSRRILNEHYVISTLTELYQEMGKKDIAFEVVDLMSNKTVPFINALTQADLLIGMHGAEMILSIFMKPYSVIIELFPYGIQPDVVSFIKPLTSIAGSHFVYIPWKNINKNHSVAHPNSHPLYGGISHLSPNMQVKIKNSDNVPAVECCNNPNYLYHMFQDTWVSDDFKQEAEIALLKAQIEEQTKSEHLIKTWFFPYFVSSLTCEFQLSNQHLKINWYPPINAGTNESLKYSVFIMDKHGKFRKDILTEDTDLFVEVPETYSKIENATFYVWVSSMSLLNNAKGADVFHECV